ncbi:GtrA family protein [Brevundimonas sp.]|jgi:putative flippase GtrA|uniref:GtrA family protein n=1 Tax=Brevundimonas sp. TaxID=1871086 RepID=UPI00391897A2|nr:GtrA family protein [Brevundimonas sp.]
MTRGPRYLAVVVVGFGVDLGLALALRELFGLPLPLAAAGGFMSALVLNYVLFETWAFRRDRTTLSFRRMTATAASALIALGVRITAVAILNSMIGAPDAATAAAILVAAAALSLLVNWALVSHVFRRHSAP